jgi:hypothetical protein
MTIYHCSAPCLQTPFCFTLHTKGEVIYVVLCCKILEFEVPLLSAALQVPTLAEILIQFEVIYSL